MEISNGVSVKIDAKDKILSISYYFHFFHYQHLYFQNYIIMEEMEIIGNGEYPNSY
jgi:hypothetical protein